MGGEEGAAQKGERRRGGGGDYVIAGDSDAQQCVRMALGYLPLTLQHAATHCNTLQHTATQSEWHKITCLSAIAFPMLPFNERASRVFHVCVCVCGRVRVRAIMCVTVPIQYGCGRYD